MVMIDEARRERVTNEPTVDMPDDQLAFQLKEGILKDIEIVRYVSGHSHNLKGTFQRGLNEAATSIAKRSAMLADRTTTQETRKLEEAYIKLQQDYERIKETAAKQAEEIAELRREVIELKVDLGKARANETATSATTGFLNSGSAVLATISTGISERHREQPPLEDSAIVTKTMMDKAMSGFMSEIDGRMKTYFCDLQNRLSISPVTETCNESREAAQLAPRQKMPSSNSFSMVTTEKRGKNKKKNTMASQEALSATMERVEPAEQQAPPELTPVPEEGWSMVVKRGRTNRQTNSQRPKITPGKLSVPRSSAILLTLIPGAVDQGVDFTQVVAVARDKVDLSSLNIPYIKIKETATGARKLEVPGVLSAAKTDDLASILRWTLNETFGEGVVRVSRPTKNAEMLISGLDDAATKEEVALAVATAGGCHESQVQVGTPRRTPYGVITAWVRCPVAAAKKLTAETASILVVF